MKIYLCYIHTSGSLVPELRTVAAESDQDVPDRIMEALSDWPAIDAIKAIEVFDDKHQAMFRISTQEPCSHH